MKIIDRIEIHYFRSIYTLNLSENNDINLFIGGNDVGKSNILKSLNLFFNNAPDFETEFNFLRDLSRLRETEARLAKGRATIWIRVTFNNFLRWRSLPRKFTVKRSWNRYSNQPTDTYEKGIAPTTVARFLNRISFQYIPPVRGRHIFSLYLSLLHDALIDDEKAGVRGASNKLMSVINQSTEDMSSRIYSGLGFESTIKVPDDLKELFSALDFSTTFGKYSIPLQLRGDGIQSRHIPFILDFVARHSDKYHIWAYEEPENSLEMSRAFELAKQFADDFSKDNQIYITTHSPAFYDLSGEHTGRWLVQSEDKGPSDEPVTTATQIKTSEVPDRRLGIAALISDRAKELYEDNRNLRQTISSLEEIVREAAMAQVIVEGPSDKQILEIAFQKLFPQVDRFCEFVPATGASNAAAFILTASRMQKIAEVPMIGIVDNDHAGRQEDKKNFKSYKYIPGTNVRIVNQTNKIFFCLLPVPDQFVEVGRTMKNLGGEDLQIPLSIEFMFPPDVIQYATKEGVLELKDRFATARDKELALPINLTENYQHHLPDGLGYFAQEIADSSKSGFSKWVKTRPAEDFVNFLAIFECLEKVSLTD